MEGKQNLKCGFCRRGVEAEEVCGKLWHDAAKNCTAHQRCMQYSAGLAQYAMKRFGGFKVSKVLKEQARGKRLKCFLCASASKSKKSHSACGASSGCVDPKCKKTFHFYCARTGKATVARKMVESKEDGTTVDRYLVFCSEDHQKRFENDLKKSRLRYVDDTDDEVYRSDNAKDDSDDSSSASSDEKKETDAAKQSPVAEAAATTAGHPMTRLSESLDSHDDDDDDDFVKNRNTSGVVVRKAESAGGDDAGGRVVVGASKKPVALMSVEDNGSGIKQKSTSGDGSLAELKRRKLESDLRLEETAAEAKEKVENTNAFVICFVEHVNRVSRAVTQVLQTAANDYFGVSIDRVFVWQYNGDALSSEHFVYVLNEIGKALALNDRATAQRLVFNMVDADVVRFNDRVKSNAVLDDRTRVALYAGLRRQIARNFKSANEGRPMNVCRYCHIKGGLEEDVAFVLVADDAIVLPPEDVSEGPTDDSIADLVETQCKAGLDVGQQGTTAMATGGGGGGGGSSSPQGPGAHVEKEISGRVTEIIVDSVDTVVPTDVTDVCPESPLVMPLGVDKHVGTLGDVEMVEEGGITTVVGDVDSDALLSPDHQTAASTVARENGSKVVETSVEPDVDGVLYSWDNKTSLIDDSTPEQVNTMNKCSIRNMEFERLLRWLKPRIGSVTGCVRFPMAEDFAILSPVDEPQLSVTWKLAETFAPRPKDTAAKHRMQAGRLRRGKIGGGGGKVVGSDELGGKVRGNGEDSGGRRVSGGENGEPVMELQEMCDLNVASSVVFIGPFDTNVVRHCEIVRRRVLRLIDNMSPVDADIFCITDVGCSLGLSRLSDIVDTTQLQSDIVVRAYTSVSPKHAAVSCVLLHLHKSTAAV